MKFFAVDKKKVSKAADKRVSLRLISEERGALMGLSIIWIMFFHSYYAVGRFQIISNLKRHGNMGVDFFLFLSAIGLFYSLTANNNVLKFYKKRILRILPATVICLLPWLVYLSYTGRNITTFRFLLDITSLGFWIDGYNRAWYIALTLLLYLFYPLIFRLIKPDDERSNIRTALIIIVVDILINVVLQKMVPDWYGPVELAMTRVPVFIAGSFLAPYVCKKKEISNLTLLLLAEIAMLFYWLLSKQGIYQYSMNRYVYMWITICSMPVLAVILNRIRNSAVHRFLTWIGKYTLEIYLIHEQLLTVMYQEITAEIAHKNFIFNTGAIILSVILAVVVHKSLSPIIKKVE